MDKEKIIRLALIAGLIVIVDQITKALILKTFTLYRTVPIITDFFNLTHIRNPGGAFGFLADADPRVRTFMFIVVSLAATCFILYFYHKTPKTHPWLAMGFACIFGGAIGNLIDRLRFGQVVDFLDFYIGDLHWPAFNVADCAISIGMTIFIVHLLFKKIPE